MTGSNILLTILLCLALSACSITPTPLTETELSRQARGDYEQVTYGQEPIDGAISLYEAIARALSYNLDLRLELTEKLLAQKELNLSRYDQLPSLVTSFAYAGRSNFSGATSLSLLTGNQSLEPSTSSERDVLTTNLNLSWNILDFGVSYFRTQQAADRINIAEEQKRKVINQLVQDVRTTYWRAVSSDRLKDKLEKVLDRVTGAIEDSKQVETNRLDRPLTALTYQRELISIKRELQELQRELSLAKIQLAALMNLKPGEEFILAIPDRDTMDADLDFSPQLMEILALENRSELREVTYQKRINSLETKAAILELLPGFNLEFGATDDSNTFLFNNDWLNYGARVSWNLLNILRIPSTKRFMDAQDAVLDARRLALSMAVLTQVHVGIAQYRHSKQEYETASDYYETQVKILEQIYAAEKANSISEQTVIREEMNSLVAEVRYDIAYADIENAYANAYASIGFDPIPYGTGQKSIKELSEMIKLHFESLKNRSEVYSMKFID